MFPHGAPGFALLLLRVSVGAGILLEAALTPNRSVWMLMCAIPLSVCLCIGLLTPIAACLTIPIYLIDAIGFRQNPALVVIPIAQAIALSLLGPGGTSVDAHLYGRRQIEIPRKRSRNSD